MPSHTIKESRTNDRVWIEVGGEKVADSRDAIVVEEDGYPKRFYLPRTDVDMDKVVRTSTTTHCPFKGQAHYFSLRAGGDTLADAVWTYEDPYDEHQALKDRLAFYDDKIPAIHIHVDPAR